MSGFGTIGQMMREISVGRGKHRTARVLRFIHRHPDSHANIIGQLRRKAQRHERRTRKRFQRLQRGGKP